MLKFIPNTITLKRRVESGLGSDLITLLENKGCNIQPLSSDDILYDLEIKQYILFLETNNSELFETSDLIIDENLKEYKVDSIDWFQGPVKNTIEVILIENKDED